MSFNRNNNNNNNKVYFPLGEFNIKYARVLSDKVVTADLYIPGLILKGIKYISTDKGEWLCMAQSQGRDGKYYNNYSIYLSDKDSKKVMDAIRASL